MPGAPEEAATAATTSSGLRVLAAAILAYCQRYEAKHDERAVFAFMYSKMTEALADYVEASAADFDDARWIVRLAEAFAGRFVKAMDLIDSWPGGQVGRDTDAEALALSGVPKPWADVYVAIRHNKSYVLEDMIFSMMAHISYDLPFALRQVGMESGGASHVADYHRMNRVLGSRIDEIQDDVARRYSRALRSLDKLAGSYDEFFTNYGIRAARAVAWYNAQRISDPLGEADGIRSIESSTNAFIDSVRRPDIWWARVLVSIARFLIPARRRWPA